jgi:peptidoglycan hydrolase-like amidase
MSASGALCMAKDGKDWKTILKYFYTGVEVNQKW